MQFSRSIKPKLVTTLVTTCHVVYNREIESRINVIVFFHIRKFESPLLMIPNLTNTQQATTPKARFFVILSANYDLKHGK